MLSCTDDCFKGNLSIDTNFIPPFISLDSPFKFLAQFLHLGGICQKWSFLQIWFLLKLSTHCKSCNLPDYPEYDGGGVLVQRGAGLLHDGHGVRGDRGHTFGHPSSFASNM